MDDRLTNLEIKITYQERLLETLNEVLVAQRAEIDALQRRVKALEEQLHGALEDAEQTKPPHY